MDSEVLVIREFEPLVGLFNSIPYRSQRSLFTNDIQWTAFDASDELFAVGTNTGSLFLYDRAEKIVKHNLAAKEKQDEVTKVKIVKNIDTVVAAGRASGSISIFQLLSPSGANQTEVRVFLITDMHHSTVTCLEWSQNAMKLFSGDTSGAVTCTEIDYILNSSKSYVVHRESPSAAIVQLSYNHRKLLVSSVVRSFIVHMDDGNKLSQIGKSPRKRPGSFGAVILPGFLSAKDMIIYASRPGLRLWKARTDGMVELTHLFQDNVSGISLNIHPLHELVFEPTSDQLQHSFGLLLVFNQSLLVTYQGTSLYVVDPNVNKVVCYHSRLGEITDVVTNKEEIFVLRKTDNDFLIRLSKHQSSSADEMIGKDTKKTSDNSTNLDFDINPSQIVLKLGQTAAKVTENIANKVLKEVGEIITPKKIPSWVQSGASKVKRNENDREEDKTHSNLSKTDSESLGIQEKVATESLDKCRFIEKEFADTDREKYTHQGNGNTVVTVEVMPNDSLVSPSKDSQVSSLMSRHDSSDSGIFPEKNSYDKCRNVSASELCPTQSNLPAVKHSSSVSEFHSHHVASPVTVLAQDDEIVFTSRKRSKKRSRVKLSDTVSLASVDSIESTPIQLPVIESPLHTSCPLLSSQEDGAITANDVMKEQQMSSTLAAVAAELNNKDEDLFDIDISLLRTDKPIFELISGEMSETNFKHDRSDAKLQKIKTENTVITKDSIVCNNFENHEKFPITNGLPNEETNSVLSTNSNFTASDDFSIYSNFKLCHDSVKFNSDVISLEDALEYPVAEKTWIKSEQQSASSSLSSNSLSMSSPKNTSWNVPSSKRLSIWREFSAPARLHSLCVSTRHIWCTDELQRLHYSSLSGQGLRWHTVEHVSAQQIAVAPSGWIVWRLDNGSAYAATGVTHRCPFGVKWIEVARNVTHISVGDTEAWYVKMNGEVSMQKELSKERPSYRSFRVPCSFKMAQVACRYGVVCGITTDREIVVRRGITRLNELGTEWEVIERNEMNRLVYRFDFGENGTAWVFDLLGRLWYSTGFSPSRPDGDGIWWQVSLNSFLMSESNFWDAIKLLQSNGRRLSRYLCRMDSGLLSVQGLGLWICPFLGSSLHLCSGSVVGYRWHHLSPADPFGRNKWSFIAATGLETGQSGLVWLVDSIGSVFCFIPSSSNEVNLINVDPPEPHQQCRSFSASVDVAWCVLENGHVYIRRQMAGHCLPGYGWDSVDMIQIGWGKLIHVSIGSNSVWGVHSSGRVYLRIGVHHRPKGHVLNPAWLKLDDHYDQDLEQVIFNQVFTSPDDSMVWAIDSKNLIYVRIGVSEALPIGLKWLLVEGYSARSITISNHEVYATTPGNDLIMRVGITPDKPEGEYWQMLPGSFRTISVTAKDELWAIDKDGDVYHQFVHHLDCPTVLENLMEGRLLKNGVPTIEVNDWIVY